MSQYQLICITSTASKKQKKDSKSEKTKGKSYKNSDKKKDTKTDEEQGLKAIGGKDSTIFLFRALGKILYCKRESNCF